MHPESDSQPTAPGKILPAVMIGGLALIVLGVSAYGARWARARWTSHSVPELVPHETERLARGRLLYEVQCMSCHGPQGHGDGSSADQLKPPPRDFATGAWRFGTHPDAIRRVIAQGIPGTAMPAAASITSPDLDAVVAYVRTLAPQQELTHALPTPLRELIHKAGLVPMDQLRPAPLLELYDSSGKPHSLLEWHGKPVILHFWGTTCVACLAELAELRRLVDQGASSRFSLLTVCVDAEDSQTAQRAGGQNADRLPLYVDRSGLGAVRYDAQVLPTSCIIDRQGRWIAHVQGAQSWSSPEMAALLKQLCESAN